MTVGIQPSSSQIDTQMTQLANSLRKIMEQLTDFALQINNMGQSGLETAGYDAADATTALQLVGYMTSVTQVYYGLLQQGGSGGNGAIEFNFNNALSQLWGGTVQ
jgi:hypothetical protein